MFPSLTREQGASRLRLAWHVSWTTARIEHPMAQVMSVARRGEILLIEDREDVREGLAQLLELHGFMVTEAADGDRGIRELTAQPQAFALVLLDLLLGDSMGGVDFRLRQLRRSAAGGRADDCDHRN